MKIAFFDTRSYDKASFTKANADGGLNYEIEFCDFKLNEKTAMTAQGFNNVDLKAAASAASAWTSTKKKANTSSATGLQIS